MSTRALQVVSQSANRISEQAYRYILSCSLSDGGYSFARIPPSGLMDSYYALAGLLLLGKNHDFRNLEAYLRRELHDRSYDNLPGIWAATEGLSSLGRLTHKDRVRALEVAVRQYKEINPLAAGDVYAEATSGLESPYRLLRVMKLCGVEPGDGRSSKLVASFANTDGSYGRGLAVIASTYYAVAIYDLLGEPLPGRSLTVSFLKALESDCEAKLGAGNTLYLEQLHWLTGALDILGERLTAKDSIARYATGCQRAGGGFARAARIGIPTLENTFYALTLLTKVGPS